MKYKIMAILGFAIFLIPLTEAMTCELDNDTYICTGSVNISEDTEVICNNLDEVNTSINTWFFDEMISYRDKWESCIYNITLVPKTCTPTDDEVRHTILFSTLKLNYTNIKTQYDNLLQEHNNQNNDVVAKTTYDACTKEVKECADETGTIKWQYGIGGMALMFLLLALGKVNPGKALTKMRGEPRSDVERELPPW